jgi:flagellar biosynthetic protein FlhB
MSEEDAGEKTEEPTDRRRDEFRERGQIAKSQDILSLLILSAGLSYFLFFGRFIYERMGKIFTVFFQARYGLDISVHSIINLTAKTFMEIGYLILPLIIGVIVLGVLGNMMQVGVLITTKTLEPKLDKLNFFAKFIPAFFNKQSIGNLFTSLIKLFFILLVVYYTLNGDAQKIAQLPLLPLELGLAYMFERILMVFFNIVLIMVIIAVLDYAWQVYTMEQKMKMSKQEVKDEHKLSEGNPLIKSQRRKRALEMFNQRMMTAVPEADVIINNPTHFSVALRFDKDKDIAPVVVAKGADLLALRIRRLAEQHDVAMVDNPTLARALYRQAKVGKQIPYEFYRAVAEILYYVYRLRHGSRLQRQNQVSTSRPLS